MQVKNFFVMIFISIAALCCPIIGFANDDFQRATYLQGEIDQYSSEIGKLERIVRKKGIEKGAIKEGMITFKYPLGMPKEAVEKEKEEIQEDITKINSRISILRENIKTLRKEFGSLNLPYKITSIYFYRSGSNENWHLHVRVNGTRICDAQDTREFQLDNKQIWSMRSECVVFRGNHGIDVELWDQTLWYFKKVLTIHINGEDCARGGCDGYMNGWKYDIKVERCN